MKKLLFVFVSFFLVFWACSKNDDVLPNKTSNPIPNDTTPPPPFDCRDTTFEFLASKGQVKWIKEASGLAFSSWSKKRIWTHEDSNNQNKLYLFSSEDGKYKGSYTLQGAKNKDWEDMAISYGPEQGKFYIYVADFGDNKAKRNKKQIYRIKEPDYTSLAEPFSETLSGVEEIEFVYPDGKRDAECLLIDPLTKDIYIITKREAKSVVYRLVYPQSTTSVMTAEKIHTLDFRMVTGGDVSHDGKLTIVKTYEKLFLWKRKAGETFADMIKREPYCLPCHPESQGEAITFSFDANEVYTLSEYSNGVVPELIQYRKKK